MYELGVVAVYLLTLAAGVTVGYLLGEGRLFSTVARGWSLLTDAAWMARLHVRTQRRNLRWWWSGPTVDELTARAAWEMCVNPTITVYTFDGGVEQRRPMRALATVEAAIDTWADALAQLTVGVQDFSNRLRQALFAGIGR